MANGYEQSNEGAFDRHGYIEMTVNQWIIYLPFLFNCILCKPNIGK